MKPSLSPDHALYEYHWDGPRRLQPFPVWQPRQTTLFVVFDGESRHLFSSARILFYYSKAWLKDARSNVWDITPLGSVVHSFRNSARTARANAPALPKLTVAFEVSVGSNPACNTPGAALVLRSPASVRELRRDAIDVLLDREVALTSETLSLTLSFTHSTFLCTPITSGQTLDQATLSAHPVSQLERVTTRIVRVLPPPSLRPRITDGRLPTELLIKTFEDAEFRNTWHDDLLSFAQVCRAWSCAMIVLQSRLTFSEDERRHPRSPHVLDAYALATALNKKPVLGHALRHLTTNNLAEPLPLPPLNPSDPADGPLRRNSTRFTAALVAVLRTAKNVQSVHLSHLDPSQSDALFSALHDLRHVKTVSIGPAEPDPKPITATSGFLHHHHHHHHGAQPRLLSVGQLARCMTRWPVLQSIKIHHLHPGKLALWRFTLRPPVCALTQLSITRSHVGDKDLAHLFSSSTHTLERVVLDRVEGVTNAGLVAFLLAVSHNVAYLTVRDVALPPLRQMGNLVIGRKERALDVVVDKMPRLRELRISGDVASEFMLARRSKMFIAGDRSEETRVPVVRLWLEDVPRLCGFAADGKWPGWSTPGKVPLR